MKTGLQTEFPGNQIQFDRPIMNAASLSFGTQRTFPRMTRLWLHVVALLALRSGEVSAEQFGDFTYSVEGGNVTIIDCAKSATGNVVSPATIDGKPVTRIGQSAFARCTGVTSVTIGNSVTMIGHWAFLDCTKLTSVYFEGNAPQTGLSIFTGVDTKNLKLHVYEGSTGFDLAPWDIHPKISIKRPSE